ncbi:retrovirus-related pol polyprotein [Plakobranchus ocellatus]|uniref:Retrovirus-related pol polyprotein n=1 Tax=Plakobranchus ocellatus TaxID=259542 RepID=A0AAV4CL48_9GAST|nr:retrovirus-related pol polyprotein [Plakobranchus ocellatus]
MQLHNRVYSFLNFLSSRSFLFTGSAMALVNTNTVKGLRVFHPKDKVSTGKRQGGLTVASTTAGPPVPQLIITDSITKPHFLVDTGAQVSVIPPMWHERHFGQRGQALQAVNGTAISTYGSRDVKLRFHGMTYEARLIIADVKRPLLGADFFRRHNLLIDLNGQRLIEADSYLSSPCSTSRVTKTELAFIERDWNKFRKVLQEFPALLSQLCLQNLLDMAFNIILRHQAHQFIPESIG